VSTQSYKVVKGTSKSSTTEMRTVMRTTDIPVTKVPNSIGARCGKLMYSSIPGNRNWQIETADWNLDVRLDILGFRGKETLRTPRNIA